MARTSSSVGVMYGSNPGYSRLISPTIGQRDLRAHGSRRFSTPSIRTARPLRSPRLPAPSRRSRAGRRAPSRATLAPRRSDRRAAGRARSSQFPGRRGRPRDRRAARLRTRVRIAARPSRRPDGRRGSPRSTRLRNAASANTPPTQRDARRRTSRNSGADERREAARSPIDDGGERVAPHRVARV